MARPRSPWLVFALGLLAGCDEPPLEPVRDAKPAVAVEAEEAEPKVATAEAATAVAPIDPRPPLSDAELLAALAGQAESSEDTVSSGWTHYKAERWPQAQAQFAKATLEQPHSWKHPFNLACASARGGNERMARIGLTEALARDRANVESKARRDADLASVRASGWFEPLLGGDAKEPVIDPGAAAADPPAPASTGEPTIDLAEDEPEGEPARTPPRQPRTTSKRLAKPQLATVSEQLAARHGLAVRIRSSLALAADSAFVVYDYRRFDACLLSASKEECRKQLAGRTYYPRIRRDRSALHRSLHGSRHVRGPRDHGAA